MTSRPALPRGIPSRLRAASGRFAPALRQGLLASLVTLAVACGGGSAPPTPGPDVVVPTDGTITFSDGRTGDGGGDALPPSDGGPDAAPPGDADGPADAAPECRTDGECDGRVAAGTCLVARCAEGRCVAEPLGEGTVCDDQDRCTGDGRCDDAGLCLTGVALPCDDDDPCTTDECSAADGCTHRRRAAGASCADPDDACDGSVCTADGECDRSVRRPDGFPCDGGDSCDESTCRNGVCVPIAAPDNTPCDDASACTEGDRCVAGACIGAPRGHCDDDDGCTTDVCLPATGACEHAPAANGTDCDDGDPCTAGETCASGVCEEGEPVVCDDHDPCTVDSCSPTTGWCLQDPGPDGTPCDDGDPCTTGDLCTDGYCGGLGPVTCDDGDPCTTDRCDPTSGQCVTSPAPNGSACQGADACQLWSCQVGVCTARGPKDCGDGNSCTQDLCNSATGACGHPPVQDGTGCSDGDLCTLDDTCQAGVCVGGAPPPCDDGDPCTVDACARATGECGATPGNDGAVCDDDEPCSADDRCAGGTCAGAWDDPFCCVGDADCAVFDACAPGACVAGHCAFTPPVCDAPADGCTAAVCDRATGTCRDTLLCGPHLLWGTGFEDGEGLHAWPPVGWAAAPEAAAGGALGLRLTTAAARGVVVAHGPWVAVPRGTAELRLSLRVAAEGAASPDGTLTVRFAGVDGAETTLAGATDGFTTLALPVGGDTARTGRLELEWDGAAGLVDVDDVRLLHYGLNGCVRSRIDTLPTHVGRAEGVTIARGEGDEVLVGWAETRTGTGGVVETEVSAVLLDPLREERSARRLLSTWAERTADLRLRGARANDGTFLVLYPSPLGDHTIEGALVRDITQVPGRILLPLDHAAAWAIDATALAAPPAAPWDGWSLVWSGPNDDGDYNSLRSQRWAPTGTPVDAEPWRGGPAEWRDARHVEGIPLENGTRLAAWVARRVAEPFDQAILARGVSTFSSPPPVSATPLYVLTTADPAEGSLSHLRLAPLDDGFAVSVMRGEPDGSGPWQLEVRRHALDATLLPPTDPAAQVAHASVPDSTPAPLVGLPDGGLTVVWRHRVGALEFVWYRAMTAAGEFAPPPEASPAVLAGSALPLVSRGAPDAVRHADLWVLAAWPAGDQSIEYRLLGTGCPNGLVRCNGTSAEVCAGDRYLPFAATCEGEGCGTPLTCE